MSCHATTELSGGARANPITHALTQCRANTDSSDPTSRSHLQRLVQQLLECIGSSTIGYAHVRKLCWSCCRLGNLTAGCCFRTNESGAETLPNIWIAPDTSPLMSGAIDAGTTPAGRSAQGTTGYRVVAGGNDRRLQPLSLVYHEARGAGVKIAQRTTQQSQPALTQQPVLLLSNAPPRSYRWAPNDRARQLSQAAGSRNRDSTARRCRNSCASTRHEARHRR